MDWHEREPVDRLRVVTINSHQPYLHLLSALACDFVVVDTGLSAGTCRWDGRVRPLPARFRTVSLAEATVEAGQKGFDVALAHNVTDLLALKDLCDHRVLIIHSTLAGRIAYESSQTDPADFARVVCRYLEHVPAQVVFISKLKAESWLGLPGTVIVHGIPVEEYGGYTGEHPAVLRVANLQRQRDVLLNHTLQQVVLHGIPTTLYGWNPDVPGAAVAGCWEELKAAYCRFRCFLLTNRAPLEDGYNLALLEAMASGMPAVTTPHPTSPIRHYENGLVGEDADLLREHITRLLHDRDLAIKLGAEACRTVREVFPQDTFLNRWEHLLQRVADGETVADARSGADRDLVTGTGVTGPAHQPQIRSRPHLTLVPGSGRAPVSSPPRSPGLHAVPAGVEAAPDGKPKDGSQEGAP